MAPEDQIAMMKKAITQAIKVMGDRFGSTEEDVAKAIQGLRASLQPASSRPGGQSPPMKAEATDGA